MTARFVRAGLFSITATGNVGIFLQEAEGSDFGNPASFSRGVRVANYSARLQTVLTVIAPDRALIKVDGELVQKQARAFTLAARRYRLGRRALGVAMSASGPGTRTDPAIPRAIFDVAGRFLVAAKHSGPATGVQALDGLSARLLAAAPALRLGVARAGSELEAVYRLRYHHVVERGWARPEDFADDLERDAHDDHAVHIAVWEAGTLVGTVRLVVPAGGRQLPVEESFGVTLEPHGAVVEVGRLLIAPSHRGDPSHRAWGALFARAWLETRARGLSVLGGAASTGLIDLLRALGLPFEILGPARAHWGEQRHPVRLDPSANHRPRWF